MKTFQLIEDRMWDKDNPHIALRFTGTEDECVIWIHDHTCFSSYEAFAHQGYKLVALPELKCPYCADGVDTSKADTYVQPNGLCTYHNFFFRDEYNVWLKSTKEYRTMHEEYKARPDVIKRALEIRELPISDINSFADLHARELLAWKESDDAQKRLYNGSTGYLYPAHQIAAIKQRREELKWAIRIN